MEILNKLQHYANIVMYIVLVLAVICVLFIVYRKFYRKKSAAKENAAVDYSILKRKDSIDYLKFDTIDGDMIVTDNGTRFVAAVRCSGFDFYSANFAEKLSVKNAYTNFIGMQKDSFTYRQSCAKVNVDDDINRYYEQAEKIKKELVELRGMHTEMSTLYEKMAADEKADTDQLEMLSARIEDTEKQIETREWRIEHIADQMDFLSRYKDSETILDRTEAYIFDWSYNSLAYPVELTKEEIFEKARKALDSRASSFIHALEGAKVKAVRMGHDELVDMFRRHFHPITADIYGAVRIKQSAFDEDIVTTDVHDDIYNGALEEFTLSMQEAVVDKAVEDIKTIQAVSEESK